MKDRATFHRLTPRSHRLVHWFGYLLIIAVVLRRRYDLEAGFTFGLALVLLGLVLLLYATESLISKKVRFYSPLYFTLQLILIQAIGLFQSYQDTWALLYIAVGFQVAVRCSRKEAWFWFGLFMISLLVTLCLEFGWVSGPGRALAYILIGVLIISYDNQVAQHEGALEESQLLLAELQEAHQKLADFAAQAEKLAAMQERDRMVQELYDSVGQKVFAIQLAAETTRLLLENNPKRAAVQIADLQEQTHSALAQMRQLIGQWRPG